MRTAFLSLANRIHAGLRLSQSDRGARTSPVTTSTARRAFYVFPWLIPAFAVLHFLANNLLLFRVSESIAVFVITMAVVTLAFIAFRLAFKSTAVVAALTGLLGTAFFSYGHISIALGERADDRYLLGLGLPLVFSLGMIVHRRPDLAHKTNSILNIGSAVLLAAPIFQIASYFFASGFTGNSQASQDLVGTEERITASKATLTQNELRTSTTSF